MKIIHNEVKCTCKSKNSVVIEMTEDEAAHLADHFKDNLTQKYANWESTRKLAKQIMELAGQW